MRLTRDNILFALIALSIFPVMHPAYIRNVVLNPVFVVMAISLARFISAVGVYSLYISASVFLARAISPKIKRRKEEAARVRRMLTAGGYLFFIVLILYYIVTTVYAKGAFDVINISIGLTLTMITTFLIPIARGDVAKATVSDIQALLKKADFIRIGIKKAFYEKLVRDYGEAMALEFLALKMRIDQIRDKIFYWIFVALILASFPLLPIFILGVWVIVWWREGKKKLERRIRFSSLIVVSALLVYVLVLLMLSPIKAEFFAFTLPYLVGLIVTLFFYVRYLR